MNESDRKNIADILLVSISVSTGWKLPNEPLLSVLQSEFLTKLEEDFLSLTPAEIKYAFRNASHIKNWGADFNLNLLDQVLGAFLEKRAEVRKTYASLPMAPDDETELTEDQKREYDQKCYEFWKLECTNGVNMRYIPSTLFDLILRVDGVTPKEKKAYSCLMKACHSLIYETDQELKATDGEAKPGEYNRLRKLLTALKSEDIDEWQYLPEVQRLAKAMWCIDYFNWKMLEDLKKGK
ncbi:MAG: hypothetical protein GXC72_00755 [Chitinophagaceae bacterium]|nr:hypothetical protein [Chitinophagaceae bacterium]